MFGKTPKSLNVVDVILAAIGKHFQLRHLDKPNLRVTIPFHRKDLRPKTLKLIIKQAGLSVEDFLRLL